MYCIADDDTKQRQIKSQNSISARRKENNNNNKKCTKAIKIGILEMPWVFFAAASSWLQEKAVERKRGREREKNPKRCIDWWKNKTKSNPCNKLHWHIHKNSNNPIVCHFGFLFSSMSRPCFHYILVTHLQSIISPSLTYTRVCVRMHACIFLQIFSHVFVFVFFLFLVFSMIAKRRECKNR